MPPTPPEPSPALPSAPVDAVAERPIASALRAAAIRWAFLTVVLGATVTAFVVVVVVKGDGRGWPGRRDWLIFAVTTVVLGAVGAPLAFVEAFVARRARTREGHLRAGAIVGLTAGVGFFVAAIQLAYTLAVIDRGSLAAGADSVGRFLSQVAGDPTSLLVFVGLAAPFGPAVVARLGGRGLGAAVRFTALGGAAIASPLLLYGLYAARDADTRIELLALAPLALVAYGLVPVALHLADRLEERLGAWLSRREPQL